MSKLLLTSMLLISVASPAANRNLNTFKKADGTTGITFSLPYAAGVHKGSAQDLQGTVVLNEQDLLQSAHFEVAITSMTTGNATRDCHMREAIGIDYSKSQFPKDHVCDNNNQTPATGPDSVVFTKIIFDFQKFEQAPATPFQLGTPQDVLVTGTMTMHGITKAVQSLPLKFQMTKATDGTPVLQVLGKLALSLKDYNVQVKPFTLGPISIGVSDKASVDLNLQLAEPKL